MMLSFLRRYERADDVRGMSARQMGMSIAASWAAGPSVFLGVLFMWSFGVIPGTAWIAGNILTLALAGAFWTYAPFARQWVTVTLWTLPLFLLYATMEGLLTLINLSALKAAFDGLGPIERISTLKLLPPDIATYVAVGIGVVIVALINRYGFRGSVISDWWQYTIQITAAGLLALLVYLSSDPQAVRPELFKGNGREWILLGFMGMVTGAFTYAQIWERFAAVPATDAVKAGLWGSLYFGLYMSCIWIVAYFLTKSTLTSWLVFVIILAIATSTIDSSTAGLQFIARKFRLSAAWGSIAALAVVLSFPFVKGAGINQIWGWMALRWPFVVFAVIMTIALPFVLRWRGRSTAEVEAQK